MTTQQVNTAHSLYALYDTLPNEVQQAFIEELLQKKTGSTRRFSFCSSLYASQRRK